MICGYLLVLVTVALLGSIGHKRNSAVDFFLASRGCGAFLLVMTIFGTTMTSFALVGSAGEAYRRGIGVYGEMASWSGLIHSACFFLIGTKLWYHGKQLRLQHANPVFHRSFSKSRDRLHSLSHLGGLGRALRGDQYLGLREHNPNRHRRRVPYGFSNG